MHDLNTQALNTQTLDALMQASLEAVAFKNSTGHFSDVMTTDEIVQALAQCPDRLTEERNTVGQCLPC